MILLLGAALIAADRAGAVDVPLMLTWVATGAALTGLATIAVGIAGRRSGGLMGLALVLLLAVPVAAVADAVRLPSEAGVRSTIAEGTYTFDSVDDAEAGAAFTAGAVTIDLRDLETRGESVTIPLALALGDIDVLLPADTPAAAEVELWAGQVNWIDDDGLVTSRSTVGPEPVRFDTGDPGTPEITLDITGLAGTVDIVEAS